MTIKPLILRRIIVYSSIILFLISLTQEAYCTNRCGSALLVFLFGIIGLIFLGATITWLANPLLFISWITFKNHPKLSLICSITSGILSLSFLLFDTIIDDEAGHYNKITGYRAGYWLWVSSSLVMLAGNMVLFYLRKKNETREIPMAQIK